MNRISRDQIPLASQLGQVQFRRSKSPSFDGIGAANSKGNGLKGHLTSERGQTKNDTQPHRKRRSAREVAKGELNSETRRLAEPSGEEQKSCQDFSAPRWPLGTGDGAVPQWRRVRPSACGACTRCSSRPPTLEPGREGATRRQVRGDRRRREAGASRAHACAAATGSRLRRPSRRFCAWQVAGSGCFLSFLTGISFPPCVWPVGTVAQRQRAVFFFFIFKKK